jgi:tetratricopeptide (TPR) repeat protein
VQTHHRLKAPSDRTTTRLIIAAGLVLLIGIPLIALIYVQDQYRPAGPALVDREIQAAEDAVKADPNLLTARLALAQLYTKSGRLADAVEQYDQILIVSPDAGSALLGRASVNVALEALDAAAADFQKVVDLAKGGEMAGADRQLESAFYGLGVVALRQDRPEDAVVHLADAVNINRTDADALLRDRFSDAGEPGARRQPPSRPSPVPIGWCEPYAWSVGLPLSDTAGATYGAAMATSRGADGRREDRAPNAGGRHACRGCPGRTRPHRRDRERHGGRARRIHQGRGARARRLRRDDRPLAGRRDPARRPDARAAGEPGGGGLR